MFCSYPANYTGKGHTQIKQAKKVRSQPFTGTLLLLLISLQKHSDCGDHQLQKP